MGHTTLDLELCALKLSGMVFLPIVVELALKTRGWDLGRYSLDWGLGRGPKRGQSYRSLVDCSKTFFTVGRLGNGKEQAGLHHWVLETQARML